MVGEEVGVLCLSKDTGGLVVAETFVAVEATGRMMELQKMATDLKVTGWNESILIKSYKVFFLSFSIDGLMYHAM